MNQTMIFLICVRSNEEDEINERQKINKKIKEREEFFISSDEETKKSRSEDTSLLQSLRLFALSGEKG